MERYDWLQVGRLGLVGAAFFGPAYTLWFPRLEVLFPGNHKKAMVKKIALGHAVMGFVGGATFFAGKSSSDHSDVTSSITGKFFVLNFSERTLTYILHFVSFLHIDTTQVVEILP